MKHQKKLFIKWKEKLKVKNWLASKECSSLIVHVGAHASVRTFHRTFQIALGLIQRRFYVTYSLNCKGSRSVHSLFSGYTFYKNNVINTWSILLARETIWQPLSTKLKERYIPGSHKSCVRHSQINSRLCLDSLQYSVRPALDLFMSNSKVCTSS